MNCYPARSRVVIAGGSGFLGTSLATALSATGWSVVVLSRQPAKNQKPWRQVAWDGRTLGEWDRELEGAAGLINLVGRSVDCVKTPDHRDEILRSRLESTRVLGKALRAIDSPPPVWIQMSSAHIYGDPPNIRCTEESPFGVGFAPFIAKTWEGEFQESALESQRRVILRTSFVIGRDRGAGNGALRRLVPLAKFGLGGTIGIGSQGLSWIHESDLNQIFERALIDSEMCGPYIASAPNPVSSRQFMRELRLAVGMPIGLPASSWMVRFAARWLLATDPDLALYGRYVVSKRLEDEHFVFRFPHLRDALTDVLGRGGAASKLN